MPAVGRSVITLVLAVLAALGGSAVPASAAVQSRKVAPAATPPAGASRLGPVSGSAAVHLNVVLQPRDPAGLERFVAAVSDPASPDYRHYLRRGEFAHRFGAAPSTVARVVTALRAQGLHPGPVSANGLAIPVDTSAATAEDALDTTLTRFRLRGGRVAFANTAPAQLPSSVSGDVTAVVGLNNLAVPHPQLSGAATPAAVGPQACSAANTLASNYGAYTPNQLAQAYGFGDLYAAGALGHGVTVALYELEPNSTADIAAYQSCLQTSTTVSYTQVDGGPLSTDPDSGEAALDIEGVIGIAPQATIAVYQGPNDNGTGPYDTYAQIVQDDTAQVISTSWGLCETYASKSDLAAENTLFKQAAAQGQTIVAASGDDGSADCGSRLGVDDPASQPYVTGVGGTSLDLSPARAETVWNNGDGAGGGGVSSRWTMPAYQSSLLASSPSTPCGASKCREVPDVSADADPETGYPVYHGGRWEVFGGTSAAAPLWGAMTALADSSGLGTCTPSTPVGFLNPSLYALAGAGPLAYASAFHDITTGNNGTYRATTGFDPASGLGTPLGYATGGSGLVAQLCRTAPPALGTLSPASGSSAGGTVVTLTGFGFQTGTPTVNFGTQAATRRAGGQRHGDPGDGSGGHRRRTRHRLRRQRHQRPGRLHLRRRLPSPAEERSHVAAVLRRGRLRQPGAGARRHHADLDDGHHPGRPPGCSGFVPAPPRDAEPVGQRPPAVPHRPPRAGPRRPREA